MKSKINISILFLVFGIILICLGFHNVDIAQNLFRIECITNLSFYETNGYGMAVTLEDTYRYGCLMIISGMVSLIIAYTNKEVSR